VPALQFAVRYGAGVDPAAARRSLLAIFGREVLRPYPGGEVGNLARVDALPYVLAGLLVVLAIGGLGLTLLGSVRRHRRELAVFEAIGFVRRQVMATVAWQATALAVIATAVGVPAGIALGRLSWRLVADDVGSVSPSIVPIVAVLLVVPATLIAATALAAGPAWTAGRIRPSEALRVE
jgi:putative ABC transport system permease protein